MEMEYVNCVRETRRASIATALAHHPSARYDAFAPVSEAPVTPQPGQVYFRKGAAGKAAVVRVRAVGEWVEYDVLHGPRQLLRAGRGRCKARNFAGWQPCPESDDYSHLDGCKIFATFLMLDTSGEPIVRCGEKRARFYLRKGFAEVVSDGVLRFTDAQTERQLRQTHAEGFSAFFLAVKNDRCVSCGAAGPLTRHHVVPRRHKPKLPPEARRCLSNVLFLCEACHRRYEAEEEPDPQFADDWRDYARRWQRHFVETLSPAHLPEGWDVVSKYPREE